ncbi:MAG: efflux RND transporter periplasmic adaptor subunit [Candidatus Omnitrophica bacterium]|nr:efflux RND transporter periplasmic adaptor subunit [Candidatus Omnitrophota bacterium]MDD5310993.1 efflux RND transporter periplasmic adaptor subunit [Candidatus Omnitrophota bacterium]MDD5546312.1 efflux RND transporter periplasmic adaptor subunit [Candidatus Omnitrophota bacterium]
MNKTSDRLFGFLKLAVVLLIIFLAVFFISKLIKKPAKAVIPPRNVETALAEKKDVVVFIESFGNLDSPNDVDIKSQVTGQIMQVNFKEGDLVKTGDLLFTIDPSQYKAQLERADAALIQDLANLKLNKDTVERNRKLLEKELISQQDFDKLQTDVTSSEAAVKSDNANIDLARINLNYCYITSPIDGLTGKRQVDLGNIVTANDGPTLVNVKTVDPLYVDFTIPERELGNVRKAMSEGKLKVVLTLEKGSESSQDRAGNEGDSYEGELHFLDNAVNNTTGTVLLRAIVPNHDMELWAGQFVTVRLHLSIKKNAVVVPYEAVQIGQQGNYIFVVSPDKKADLRNVTVGSKEDDHIIIEDGVKAGETVVTVGQMGLRPGTPVAEAK